MRCSSLAPRHPSTISATRSALTVADSFALGVQLSAPFLIVSLVYNVGLGLLGRLMPQLPVLFFGPPLQIALQLWVMMLALSGIMLVFLESIHRHARRRIRRLTARFPQPWPTKNSPLEPKSRHPGD